MVKRQVYLVSGDVAVEQIECGMPVGSMNDFVGVGVLPFEAASEQQLNGNDYHRVVVRRGVIERVVSALELRRIADGR
jgi:hypothetical protein